jgi:hypothetical protein
MPIVEQKPESNMSLVVFGVTDAAKPVARAMSRLLFAFIAAAARLSGMDRGDPLTGVQNATRAWQI